MILYLAARYTRKDEIRAHAQHFIAEGHTISSTWFDEPHGGQAQLADVQDRTLLEYAVRDLNEIIAADAFVFFSESEQTANRRGGRHVEFGYALALSMPIYVVGPRENLFHYMIHGRHFATVGDLIDALD